MKAVFLLKMVVDLVHDQNSAEGQLQEELSRILSGVGNIMCVPDGVVVCAASADDVRELTQDGKVPPGVVLVPEMDDQPLSDS